MRSVQIATIAATASVSDIIDLGLDGNLSGIITDAAWDTAGIQIEGSMDGTNFFPMFDNATVLGVTSAAASAFYAFDIHRTISARYIRVRSGTSAAPVAQADETLLTVISGHFV